jgi:hypothetical protein
MVKRPDEAHIHLESNILTMPPNVEVVKSICLGKEHILALVEIKGINSNKL